MSDNYAFHLRPPKSVILLQNMVKVAASFQPGTRVLFRITANIDNIQNDTHSSPSELASHKNIIKMTEFFDSSDIIKIRSVHIKYDHPYYGEVVYSCLDDIRATIKLSAFQTVEAIQPILASIEETFELLSYSDVVNTDGLAALEAALQLRERAVADLSDQVKSLGTFLSKAAIDTAEFHKKIADEQQKAFEQRLAALEDQYRKRQDALEQRRQEHDDAIAQREKSFQEKVSGFETHEAKYMRRELLKKLTDVLRESESLSLSKRTSQKRASVHMCVGGVLLVSLGVAVSMGYKIFQATAIDWHVLAPFSAGFVTFALTMVYYLKWNDRWFREHADAEFAAKRYKADIIRASWVAELVSEWAKEGKGDLPPELIAAYTRSLFRDVGSTRVSEHPMDHLTGIMKRATEFDIGKGVFSVRGYKPDSKKSE